MVHLLADMQHPVRSNTLISSAKSLPASLKQQSNRTWLCLLKILQGRNCMSCGNLHVSAPMPLQYCVLYLQAITQVALKSYVGTISHCTCPLPMPEAAIRWAMASATAAPAWFRLSRSCWPVVMPADLRASVPAKAAPKKPSAEPYNKALVPVAGTKR